MVPVVIGQLVRFNERFTTDFTLEWFLIFWRVNIYHVLLEAFSVGITPVTYVTVERIGIGMRFKMIQQPVTL